jgi:hypothetical protein
MPSTVTPAPPPENGSMSLTLTVKRPVYLIDPLVDGLCASAGWRLGNEPDL